MEIDQLGRLRDIREACSLIESYMAGVSSKDFFEDTEKQDAVIRRIEIIGEATAHLSEATRAQLPALPFRQMRGMRNIVAHDYGHVDVGLAGGFPRVECTLAADAVTNRGNLLREQGAN